jgi:hypothetical protein
MRGSAVGIVVSSKSKLFPVGTYAEASPGWTEIAILKEKHLIKIEVPSNGRLTDALGVLGEARRYNPSSAWHCKWIMLMLPDRIDRPYGILWTSRRRQG